MTVPRIVWIGFSRFSGSAPENEMSLAWMCALPPIVWAILRRRGVHVDRLRDPVVAAHPAGADPPQEPGHAAVLRLEARDDDRRELKLERPLARRAEAQAHVALEDRLALLDVLRVPQVARHVLVAEELDPKLVRIARLERGGDKHAVDAVARAEVLAVEPERELDVAPRLDLGRVEGRTGWREDGERRLAVHVARVRPGKRGDHLPAHLRDLALGARRRGRGDGQGSRGLEGRVRSDRASLQEPAAVHDRAVGGLRRGRVPRVAVPGPVPVLVLVFVDELEPAFLDLEVLAPTEDADCRLDGVAGERGLAIERDLDVRLRPEDHAHDPTATEAVRAMAGSSIWRSLK